MTRIIGGLATGVVLFAVAKFGGYVVALHKLARGHDSPRDVGEASVAPGTPAVVGERAASPQTPRRAPGPSSDVPGGANLPSPRPAVSPVEDDENVTELRAYLRARAWHPSVQRDGDSAA